MLSASIQIIRTPWSRIIAEIIEAEGSQPARISVGIFTGCAWLISLLIQTCFFPMIIINATRIGRIQDMADR